MAKSKGHLQIDVLGTSFAIEANEQSEYLEKIYTHYKNVLSDVEKNSGVSDTLKIAIIAGILLSDELAKEKLNPQVSLKLEQDAQLYERSARKMIELLDSVLDSYPMTKK